jgi:hypothetical protein
MRSAPPEVLKTWPKPNYIDPVTRGPGLMVVELTLLPLAMIIVFLRMWVRIAWLKKSWWDDYLMVVAMVGTVLRHHRVAMLTYHRSSPSEPPSWLSWQHKCTAGINMCGT